MVVAQWSLEFSILFHFKLNVWFIENLRIISFTLLLRLFYFYQWNLKQLFKVFEFSFHLIFFFFYKTWRLRMKNSSSNFLLDRSGWHSGSNGDIKKEKNFMTKKTSFQNYWGKKTLSNWNLIFKKIIEILNLSQHPNSTIKFIILNGNFFLQKNMFFK